MASIDRDNVRAAISDLTSLFACRYPSKRNREKPDRQSRDRAKRSCYDFPKLGGTAMEEIDIWRTATLLIARHGEDALFEAALRADDLFAENDFLGGVVWKRIGHTIRGA